MYPKVVFPSETSKLFENNNECAFSFKYASHFSVKPYIKKQIDSIYYPCWFDLHSDTLNATLHLSYLSIKSQKDLETNILDAFKMVDEHNIKASYRNESLIEDKSRSVYGIQFEMQGEVASPYQFFITDSTSHFLRGSLYFNSKVDQDSTKIVYDYIVKDIKSLIESIQWK
jgi:gliding motility-associated lipoprotein GldD